MIKLAKQMSAATQRGFDLDLNDDEVVFSPWAIKDSDNPTVRTSRSEQQRLEAMGNSQSIREQETNSK